MRTVYTVRINDSGPRGWPWVCGMTKHLPVGEEHQAIRVHHDGDFLYELLTEGRECHVHEADITVLSSAVEFVTKVENLGYTYEVLKPVDEV